MTIPERIYNKALALGMPQFLSTCLVLQAAHETATAKGPFTSNVFLSCNNINGYKWIGQKTALGPCTGSPEGDNYAKYASIEDSVNEAVQWIKRRQNEGKFPANLNAITSLDQYAQLLKQSGWYGDTVTNYTNGLYYWSQKLTDFIKGPIATGSALLFVIILGIVAYKKKLFS
jgi:hypothetical protein